MAENQRADDSLAYVRPREQGQADAWTEEAQHRGGQRLTEVAEVEPPLESHGPNHFVACHFAEVMPAITAAVVHTTSE